MDGIFPRDKAEQLWRSLRVEDRKKIADAFAERARELLPEWGENWSRKDFSEGVVAGNPYCIPMILLDWMGVGLERLSDQNFDVDKLIATFPTSAEEMG